MRKRVRVCVRANNGVAAKVLVIDKNEFENPQRDHRMPMNK